MYLHYFLNDFINHQFSVNDKSTVKQHHGRVLEEVIKCLFWDYLLTKVSIQKVQVEFAILHEDFEK